MNPDVYHIPALLRPAVDELITDSSGIYVDATFGGGGHSRAILDRLSPAGHLFGFDRDKDAMANAPEDSRFTFVYSDFRFIPNFLRFYGVDKIDGILADLGVSFHHFDDRQRGFTFREDAPLDMRMNQDAPLSAARVLEEYSEQQLSSLFRNYGDMRQGGLIAKAIVKARLEAPVDTTFRLIDIVRPFISPRKEKKELAQVFQALRIEVNNEMDSLRDLLANAARVLKPGGRFAVITYHSLEDRLVKNFFRAGNFDGIPEKDFFGRSASPWNPVGRNPLSPSEAEIEANPRSRSAKLRVAEYSPLTPSHP